MRLGVIGINEKVADLKLREKLAKICQERFSAEVCSADSIPLVLLSTCNRTEIYFSTNNLAEAHIQLLELIRSHIEDDFDQKMYSFFGKDCLQHLARVASGLDSAIIAETEIQGQVRTAYEAAARHRSLPHELHFAFQKSLKIGKQVRKELPLARGIPDLEHAILSAAQGVLANPFESRLLFVGASDINHKVLRFMKRKGVAHIAICNRSQLAAQKIAAKHDIDVVSWASLSSWRDYDWVVFGTKAPDYLVDLASIPQDDLKTRLLVDLSVPRNIDPAIARCSEVSLWNIDQLHDLLHTRRQSLAHVVERAEYLVAEAAYRLAHSFQRREQRRLLCI
jgi:glutamyl-tRNA reductase